MTQTWDAQAYGENGSFVHELASGVVDWLAAQPGEENSTWAAAMDS